MFFKMKMLVNHNFLREWLIGIIIFVFTLMPRLINLGSDMANFDSQYWMPRITDFAKAIIEKDWANTYQQYHPGTVLLWTSGFSKLFYERVFEYRHGFNPRYIPQHFNEVNFWAILPLVVIISFLLTISFYKVRRLFGTKTAIIFLLFINLEPFFLGISRFLHLTALSTLFGFVSFLFYLDYIKRRRNIDLIISGLLLGLGVTTKISLLIMIPVFLALATYYVWINHKQINIKKEVSSIIYSIVTIGILILILFLILNPFMWVNPLFYIQKIYQEGILETGFGDSAQDTLFKNKYLFYFEYSLYRLMPITFLLFISGFINYFRNFKKNSKQNISYIFIYFFVYYLFLSIPSKLKDRYLVELIPSILLIASYGFASIFDLKKKLGYLILAVFILLTVLNIYRYHPIYSYYHSDLVLGPNGLSSLGIKPFIRGEYYADVAHYLNARDSKPAEKTVLIPNATARYTFSPFYIGKTYSSVGNIDKNRKVNYVVARKDNKVEYLEYCKLEKIFGPRNPLGDEVLFLLNCNEVEKGAIK